MSKNGTRIAVYHKDCYEALGLVVDVDLLHVWKDWTHRGSRLVQFLGLDWV